MKITVNEETNGMTVREYLKSVLKLSSGMIKRYKFREGGMTVNGSHVTVRYVLKNGDILMLCDEDRSEDTCPYMIPVDLPLGIIYEDSDICAVDKPPFMPAHPSHSHRLDTVANALAFKYSASPYVFRPVNRLDRDTSGIMLTANNRLAASRLYASMVRGDIVKLYIAVLDRAPEPSESIIDKYMRRLEGSVIERRIAESGEDGAKRAVTLYKTLFCDSSSGRCAVMCAPVTGRTHQLRVHLASIGCPICGDTMYGSSDDAINRQALHAAYIAFPHPSEKKTVSLMSPLPKDMQSLLGNDAEKIESIFSGSLTDSLCEYIKSLKKQEGV